MNSILDAVGVSVKELPVTPENVFELLTHTLENKFESR